MDSISPLAKILAEANGIDWRSIPGSGEGGSVVEQDILNYLSRIMSGDEEPPATPVDEAPPGWTGEMPPMPSVAAGGLQALSAAGVESDITDFVAQQAHVVPTASGEKTPTEPLAAQPTQAEQFRAPEFDASEFEIDEEPEQAAGAYAAEPQAEQQYAAAQHPEPMIHTEPVHTEPVHSEPVHSESVHSDSAPMQAAESEFELDDLDDGPEVLASSETTPSEVSVYAEAEQGEVSQEPTAHAPMMSEPEAQQTELHEPAVHEPATDEPAVHEPVAALSAALPHTDSSSAAVPQADAQGASTSVAAQMLNPEPAAVAAAAGGFGLGGFLSRLYGGKAKQDQAQVDAATPETAPETVQPETVQPDAVHSEAVQPEAVQPEPVHAEQPAPQEPEPTIGTAHDLPAPEQSSHAEPVLGEPLTLQAPPTPGTPVAAPLVADQWRDQEAAAPSQDAEPEVAAQPEQAAEHHPEQMVEQTAAEPAQVAQIDYSQMDLGQPIALPEAHEDASGLGMAAGAGLAVAGVAAFASADAAAPTAAPTAANAITLRLNVDLSALEMARAQVSEALFRDVPITLLVARAAARTLGTLGLHEAGQVALANHAGQPLSADPSGDLRASLGGLKQVSDVQPALTVLDAAELGLDELHRGECSLSVGRMAGGGSALSLRGEIDPARGAQFLHEVEALLHTPIKLLF